MTEEHSIVVHGFTTVHFSERYEVECSCGLSFKYKSGLRLKSFEEARSKALEHWNKVCPEIEFVEPYFVSEIESNEDMRQNHSRDRHKPAIHRLGPRAFLAKCSCGWEYRQRSGRAMWNFADAKRVVFDHFFSFCVGERPEIEIVDESPGTHKRGMRAAFH